MPNTTEGKQNPKFVGLPLSKMERVVVEAETLGLLRTKPSAEEI
jgi:hypothetical protein